MTSSGAGESDTIRELDLVLVGATGFVGRLTARHLLDHAPDGVRVALAGRSAERLARLKADLGAAAEAWPLITVDVTDPAQAADLAGRTRVVVSTVGPYLRYGLALVQACAAAGTDYADLTGETLFVRRSIDSADEPARATGARIVHSCGFDSVPSDLGVGLNRARAAADGQGELTDTVLRIVSLHGGISGGTIDSLRQQVLETRTEPRLRRLAADPRALAGPDGPRSPSQTKPRSGRRRPGSGVSRDPGTGRFQAPFVMGGFNRQIVVRSTALLGGDPGGRFRYREVVDTGTGPVGALTATAVAAGSTALLAGMWFAATRRILDRVLPDPGVGPSEATRRRGRFRLAVRSETTGGAHYETVVGAGLDPGYEGTAVMLGQAGLALVEDPRGSAPGGVLTPMVALGEAYAERLRTHGFTVATERLSGPTAGASRSRPGRAGPAAPAG